MMKFLTIFFLSIFALKSCGSDANSNSKNAEAPSGTYHITALSDNDNLSKELTIIFDNTTNRVSGFSGCNQFFGEFKIEGNSLSFDKMGSTRKMCQPAANQLESTLLESLGKINSFSSNNNVLNFNSDSNTLIKAVQK